MIEPTLAVEDLAVEFATYGGTVQAVRGVSFQVGRGETLAIVGESGCGKSVTVQALMGLIPMPPGRITQGRATLEGKNILHLPPREANQFRGVKIGMIFQDPMTSLNPTMTIGDQIAETLKVHRGKSHREAFALAIELLEKTHIPEAAKRARQYPFEFSGGMLQRAMIAQSLACNPSVLIADEPTTALDVTIQAQILELMQELKTSEQMSIVLITHDLAVVARMADRVAVMYAGQIVEAGSVDDIFYRSSHPYTLGLKVAMPSNTHNRDKVLTPILGSPPDLFKPPPGCGYFARCTHAMNVCRDQQPPVAHLSAAQYSRCWLQDPGAPEVPELHQPAITGNKSVTGNKSGNKSGTVNKSVTVLIETKDLKKHFIIGRKQTLHAVDGVSLGIAENEIVGLVGESGSGKSTFGKTLAGLHPRTSGEIYFDGQLLPEKFSYADHLKYSREMQMIFQDPYSSLNPRMTVLDIVGEGLRIQGQYDASDKAAAKISNKEIKDKVAHWLTRVGLNADHLSRYPHEFSGGQRQRIGIARAMIVEPKFVVCDEPISALDVSVQAQVVNLLDDLKKSLGLTLLFIAHDLSMVRYVSDRMAVMYLGALVEIGTANEVFFEPQHPYTQLLVGSNPEPDPKAERARQHRPILGEVTSPVNIQAGCRFADRCPKVLDLCRRETPELIRIDEAREVACHLFS